MKKFINLVVASLIFSQGAEANEQDSTQVALHDNKDMTIKLSGSAAETLYKNLNVVETSGLGFEGVTNTDKEGENIRCKKTVTESFIVTEPRVPAVITYYCGMALSEIGRAKNFH